MEDGEVQKLRQRSRSRSLQREVTPEWDESSHKEKRHRSKKHRSNKQKSKERNTKKVKKSKKEKPKILIETKPIETIIQNALEQQENEQIELENKKMDEFIISDEEEDDKKQIVRRQEERALIFQKYQMETGLDEIYNNVIQEPQENEEKQQIVDENRSKYFKMLDEQRNCEQSQPKIGNIGEIDMFDEESIENEEQEMQQHNGEGYEIDDECKYYRINIGEQIKDYKIMSKCGKGVFGNVCKAIKDKEEVAIKFIRSEEVYLRSGERERNILKILNEGDPHNKKHILRLVECFEHKKHLCLVFEAMDVNLRDALKLYSKNQGLDLDAIRSYAMQLFVALAHLRKHRIIHADIKPDNILISKDTKLLKLCDFGTAFNIEEATIIEYLVSRFYRAPEIILGHPYDCAIDMWSTACTLYELYTGQFLFAGDNNNDMLKLHVQTLGKFSIKQLRRSTLSKKYFDAQSNFLSTEKDPITKSIIVKPILLGERPTRSLQTLLHPREKELQGENLKKLQSFRDLLEKCLQLDPKNRISPQDALFHPFITQTIKK